MSTEPSPAFIKRTRDPSLPSPARFERVPKAPGSLELVRGQWVKVQ